MTTGARPIITTIVSVAGGCIAAAEVVAFFWRTAPARRERAVCIPIATCGEAATDRPSLVTITSRCIVAAVLALLSGSSVDVVVTADGERTDQPVALRGVHATGIALLAGRHVGVAVAASWHPASQRACFARVAVRRIHGPRITLLALIRIDHPVSTQWIDQMASGVATIQQRAIQLAIVALLGVMGMEIGDAISAGLVRVTISAAPIAIRDVAVVADFPGVNHTITAATRINAYILPRGADLLCLADLITADVIWPWKCARSHDRDRDHTDLEPRPDRPGSSISITLNTHIAASRVYVHVNSSFLGVNQVQVKRRGAAPR